MKSLNAGTSKNPSSTPHPPPPTPRRRSSLNNPKRRRREAIIACAGLAPLIWVWERGEVVAEQPQATMQGSDTPPQVNVDGWTSSTVCGQCHQAIHAVWRQSLHATSWTNGVFQAGLRRCIDTYGEDKSRLCLSCHAPMVRHGNDGLSKESITREGVSCDFCHSINAVELTDPKDPVRLTIGKSKYGPLQHAQSPAHQIVNSDLHKRSEFCATCHEYKNARGITILGTYGEWKNSSYAKRGTQCQDCHMPLVPGRTVALDVKRDGSGMVNLHNISGSHDLDRVRKAIALSVASYEWMGDRLWVYIKVANEGSGHCFPTGLPMHRAVLEITLQKSGEVIGRREIPFEVVMLDENGRPIQREHEVFVSAASVRSDSRLKPNEVRTIDISFRDIKPSRLEMTASLYYEYSTETLVVDEKGERIEPVEMRFLVASRQHSMKQAGQ